jgi:hypothetical protein
MSNIYFSDNGARNTSINNDGSYPDYDESVGIDIDGARLSNDSNDSNYNLFDYDLLNRPAVSGSGSFIHAPEDGGFPDRDDYELSEFKDRNGNVISSNLVLNKNRIGDVSTPMDDMIQVSNGRLPNSDKVTGDNGLKQIDIVIHKDHQDTSVKGLLEKTSVSDIFFSEINIGVIQDTIRYKVYGNTNQVISKQSDNSLYIIMRSIMLQFSNFNVGFDEVKDEIKRLNEMVVKYSVDNVSSNVKQHMGYIDDISKLPTPMDRPSFSNTDKNYTYDISNLL